MDVVILAGGRCEPELASYTGVEFRAEVPYKGRSMAQIVLEAVKPVGDPILVGGPAGLHNRQVEGGVNFIDSVGRGIAAVRGENFLLTTVDLPCLTTEAVADFVQRSDPSVMFNYPVIRVEDCERAFPGMKRTSLKLREGRLTGGNLAFMQTDLMRQNLPLFERAYQNRKKVVSLAAMVGFGTLARMLLAQIVPATFGLPEAEKAVSRMLGNRVKVVVSTFAEIGADIDNLAQYISLNNLTNRE